MKIQKYVIIKCCTKNENLTNSASIFIRIWFPSCHKLRAKCLPGLIRTITSLSTCKFTQKPISIMMWFYGQNTELQLAKTIKIKMLTYVNFIKTARIILWHYLYNQNSNIEDEGNCPLTTNVPQIYINKLETCLDKSCSERRAFTWNVQHAFFPFLISRS